MLTGRKNVLYFPTKLALPFCSPSVSWTFFGSAFVCWRLTQRITLSHVLSQPPVRVNTKLFFWPWLASSNDVSYINVGKITLLVRWLCRPQLPPGWQQQMWTNVAFTNELYKSGAKERLRKGANVFCTKIKTWTHRFVILQLKRCEIRRPGVLQKGLWISEIVQSASEVKRECRCSHAGSLKRQLDGESFQILLVFRQLNLQNKHLTDISQVLSRAACRQRHPEHQSRSAEISRRRSQTRKSHCWVATAQNMSLSQCFNLTNLKPVMIFNKKELNISLHFAAQVM